MVTITGHGDAASHTVRQTSWWLNNHICGTMSDEQPTKSNLLDLHEQKPLGLVGAWRPDQHGCNTLVSLSTPGFQWSVDLERLKCRGLHTLEEGDCYTAENVSHTLSI